MIALTVAGAIGSAVAAAFWLALFVILMTEARR